MRSLVVAALLLTACGVVPISTARDCGTTDERLPKFDLAGHDCVWTSYSKGDAVRWNVLAYTLEGDVIPMTLSFDPASGFLVTHDTRADRFGGVGGQRVFTYRCTTMTKAHHRDDISRYGFTLTNCSGDGSSAHIP
jgi:hypothetical protein